MGSNYSIHHDEDSSSSSHCLKQILEIKEMINRKCDCYVAAIEHTTSPVDNKLQKLRQEISSALIPLRDIEEIQNLGMLGMAAVLEDIESYANTQKHAIQRLLDIISETESVFESITLKSIYPIETNMLPETAAGTAPASDDDLDLFLDQISMNEIRNKIESLVSSYAAELSELDLLPRHQKIKRIDELQRLLFKVGEATVSEAISSFISELKDAAIEEIDNDLTQDMLSGDFSQIEFVQATLQHLIVKATVTRRSLEQLPFSRRYEIEVAQEEIATHVDQLIRRIQLNYVHSPEELAVVMNLQLPPGYEEEEEGEGESFEDEEGGRETAEQEQILIGNSDDDNDSDELDQSTVVEQLECSDDGDEEDGAAEGTEEEGDEQEREQAKEEEQQANGEAASGPAGEVETVISVVNTLKENIETLKHALGPFSSSPSPKKRPHDEREIVLRQESEVIIDLAEETYGDEEDAPLSQLSQSATQLNDSDPFAETVSLGTRSSRRKTVEMKSRIYSRINPPSPEALTLTHGSEVDEESDAPSERSYNTRHRSSTTAPALASASKRRRMTDDDMSGTESVTSSVGGRRQTRVMRG
jgi:hypothetical protein